MHLEAVIVTLPFFLWGPLFPGVNVPQRDFHPHPHQEGELVIHPPRQQPKVRFYSHENYQPLNLQCHHHPYLQEEIAHHHQDRQELRERQHHHRSPTPPPHLTTARRGHTPAAHGQPSSSPSLLSLACSLQHKLTTRQRRVKGKRKASHTVTRTVNNGSSPAEERTLTRTPEVKKKYQNKKSSWVPNRSLLQKKYTSAESSFHTPCGKAGLCLYIHAYSTCTREKYYCSTSPHNIPQFSCGIRPAPPLLLLCRPWNAQPWGRHRV
ncbi:hypothetical protein TCDM_12229 [Trypanosoma cruzi Dm28c]|uniref:Secreted protein n=1 Tax=Trypanosoma cruzi Dm28c TaxID=1416333 RepID=V5AWI2_TRYCR|nr:hypothetical protein TCDM_12229 [Trypanosoma cruzi Dm28c]